MKACIRIRRQSAASSKRKEQQIKAEQYLKALETQQQDNRKYHINQNKGVIL